MTWPLILILWCVVGWILNCVAIAKKDGELEVVMVFASLMICWAWPVWCGLVLGGDFVIWRKSNGK